MRWRTTLQNAWSHKSGIAIAMLLIAAPLRWVSWIRVVLYRCGVFKVEKVDAYVLVVGNAVIGGAGKTPIVMALAEHLDAAGIAAGIVSRGYGRKTTDVREVTLQSDPNDVGDEPLLIRQSTRSQVFVGQSRPDACKALLQTYPHTRVIICDDGLQHYRLWRDLEICVWDARGAGNGWTIPAGPLREPWPRNYVAASGQGPDRHIDVQAGTSPNTKGYLVSRQLAPFARRKDGTERPLASFVSLQDGPPVIALAGIAQPEVFFDMLRNQGLQLAATFALADHDRIDIDQISAISRQFPKARLLCTEKDAVKLWKHQSDAWAVPLQVEVENAFWADLDARLSTFFSTPLSLPHGHTFT